MLKKAITSVVLFVLLFSFSITSFALEYVNESYNNESDLEESIAEEAVDEVVDDSYADFTESEENIPEIYSVNLYTTIECTARSSGSTIRWVPIISGRFRCDMAPYPGNE